MNAKSAEIANDGCVAPTPGDRAERAPDVMARARALARRRGPWLALLLIFATCYYGSYYRSGISFRDEGGTVALIAKRMLEGQRPFIDVEPGYNVLWFYPVVGLYKLFGVSFVLLRAYCFALSTLTAALGFLTIERVSRRPWIAFLGGALLVLAPGMTFKNYMPLLAVGNCFFLVNFALAGTDGRKRQPLFWLISGSIVLGLTYLIRIDIGMFVTILWLGALALSSLRLESSNRERIRFCCTGAFAMIALVSAVHFPVWLDAKQRGFDKEFVGQYAAWPRSVILALGERLHHSRVSALPPVPSPPQSLGLDDGAKASTPVVRAKHSWNREVLHRMTWADFRSAKKPEQRELFVLIYLPILFLAAFVVWAGILFAGGVTRRDPEMQQRSLAALLALGAALTVFPQYFFFRPDDAHVSEFSPGYWVAVIAAAALLGSLVARRRWIGWVAMALIVCHALLYLHRMMPDRYTGTIAARNKRTHLFHGANGVDVYLTKDEYQGLTALVKVITAHSAPGEYLVAYPYHPAINLIVDRPTYEKSLYVDNATRNAQWETKAIERIEAKHPAVIVVSDWAINGNDESRFSVWAAGAKAWIQAHYDFQGIYVTREGFEVYTRRNEPLLPQ